MLLPPHDATWMWRVLCVVALMIKPFFLRLRIEGRERVPHQGGCVYAINHTAGPDYVIVGYTSPRQVFYMAKAEIFAFHPLLAGLVRSAGAFPVQRGKADTQAVDQAVKMVAAGSVVGMFPEGTRSRNGQLQRGKTGVARIAMKGGVPIVPVVVINSEPVLRDFKKLQARPQVTVRFGAPITPAGDADDPEAVRRLTSTIMLAMAEMLPADRRGYYTDVRQVHAADRQEFAAPEQTDREWRITYL